VATIHAQSQAASVHFIEQTSKLNYVISEMVFLTNDRLKKHLQKHQDNPSGACDSSPGSSSVASTSAPSVTGDDGYWG